MGFWCWKGHKQISTQYFRKAHAARETQMGPFKVKDMIILLFSAIP